MPQTFEVTEFSPLVDNPQSVGTYASIIQTKISYRSSTSQEYLIVKNIAYNLQYLEFLIRLSCIDRWHSVLQTQNIKSIIMVSSSIIEAILYFEVKKNHLNLKNIQMVEGSMKSVSCNDIDEGLSMQITYYKKVDDFEEYLSFDRLIKKSERNRLLGDDHEIYADIKKIQKLRNKIHIHVGEGNFDTDFNCFGGRELTISKEVLYKILSEYFILGGSSVFDFLKEE